MSDATEAPDPQDPQPVPGSDRRPAPGERPAERPLTADDPVEATLVLRRRAPLPAGAGRMTARELAERHGADPRDLETVRRALERLGFSVLSADGASRRVRIRGTVGAADRVFGTRLQAVVSEAAGYPVAHRARTGGLHLPAELADVVTAVLGLDDRPQARAQFRVAAPRTVRTTYTPLELAEVYGFPSGVDGSGQAVAIIELGGGYRDADLAAYFGDLGVPAPTVRAVGVDGAENAPEGDPSGADGEVLLDVEVVGALAPGAEVLVYFAPNTDAGFLDAVAEAAHATPTPAAISISWGQSEDQWTAQARRAFDEALADAAVLGVTVTAAAGDNGSSDGQRSGDHVDFPAASPHVLACGGTSLHATDGRATRETVWNNGAGGGATGGGVSRHFARPVWQADAGVPAGSTARGGRGVPDVAADADPETGYRVRIDGQDSVIGGTSAVAPLWAALVARYCEALGRPLGLLQPLLYAAPAGLRDITDGDNGSFSAGPGWDACTGLGVPDGTALLEVLRRSAPIA